MTDSKILRREPTEAIIRQIAARCGLSPNTVGDIIEDYLDAAPPLPASDMDEVYDDADLPTHEDVRGILGPAPPTPPNPAAIREAALREAAALAEKTTAYDDNLQKSAGCSTSGQRIAKANPMSEAPWNAVWATEAVTIVERARTEGFQPPPAMRSKSQKDKPMTEPRDDVALLMKRLNDMLKEPAWLTFYAQEAEIRIILAAFDRLELAEKALREIGEQGSRQVSDAGAAMEMLRIARAALQPS